MNVLIVKLGATGDVVRTTPLLRRLSGSVTWITAAKNGVLLDGLSDNLRHFSWEARARALDIPYDLAINLEDTLEVALFLKSAKPVETFGAYADSFNTPFIFDGVNYLRDNSEIQKLWPLNDLRPLKERGERFAQLLRYVLHRDR